MSGPNLNVQITLDLPTTNYGCLGLHVPDLAQVIENVRSLIDGYASTDSVPMLATYAVKLHGAPVGTLTIQQ